MSVKAYEVVGAGHGRVVRPVGRPVLRSPMAHPKRGLGAGNVARPVSCVAVVPQAERAPRWLGLRMMAIWLVGVAGIVAAAHGFMMPEPAMEPGVQVVTPGDAPSGP